MKPGLRSALLSSMLRPMARWCIARSVRLPDVLEALKRVFLEVAEVELRVSGQSVNVSRLSVMTGVHRRDVTRLFKEQAPPKRSTDVIVRIIGQWANGAEFCEAPGKPRVLAVNGSQNDFSELVSAVSTDLNPGTILYELERVGVVQKTKRGVRLRSRVMVDRADAEGVDAPGAQMLGRDLEHLAFAVEENIIEERSIPNLHLTTEFDRIPLSMAPAVRRWLLDEGSKFHERVRAYLSLRDLDMRGVPPREGEQTIKVVMSTFSRTIGDGS